MVSVLSHVLCCMYNWICIDNTRRHLGHTHVNRRYHTEFRTEKLKDTLSLQHKRTVKLKQILFKTLLLSKPRYALEFQKQLFRTKYVEECVSVTIVKKIL